MKSHAPPITTGYSATDVMDVHVPVPDMDSVISVMKDGMNVGLGMAMSLRVRLNADFCIPMHCSVT